MVWITYTVSSSMLNCTPMPLNLPSRGSVNSFVSCAVVYAECGSSVLSIAFMASVVRVSASTSST